MKQWMRRFFAVLMMACLLAGNAWAEETALVDVNELLDSVITAELSDNALNFDAAYTLNALNDASQNHQQMNGGVRVAICWSLLMAQWSQWQFATTIQLWL